MMEMIANLEFTRKIITYIYFISYVISSHTIRLYNIYSQVICHTDAHRASLTSVSFSMPHTYLDSILKRKFC